MRGRRRLFRFAAEVVDGDSSAKERARQDREMAVGGGVPDAKVAAAWASQAVTDFLYQLDGWG